MNFIINPSNICLGFFSIAKPIALTIKSLKDTFIELFSLIFFLNLSVYQH